MTTFAHWIGTCAWIAILVSIGCGHAASTTREAADEGPEGATLAEGHHLAIERYEPGPDLHDWLRLGASGTPFAGELPPGRSWLRVRGGLDHPPAPVDTTRFVLTLSGEGSSQRFDGEILAGPS